MTQTAEFDYGRLLVVQHASHTGPAALAPVLDARAHRRPWQLVDAAAGTPFPALEGVRGILVLGGPLDAGDELIDWLGGEVNALQDALEAGIPIFGLELGAQLLAVALDGRIGPREPPRVGYLPLRRTEAGREDEVFAGWPDGSAAVFAHDEDVIELPVGATGMLELNGDGHGDVVAWRAPDATSYGVAFHPETTAADLAAWTSQNDYRARFEDAGVDPDEFAADADRRDQFLQAVGVSLVGRWVDEVVGANDPDPARGGRG